MSSISSSKTLSVLRSYEAYKALEEIMTHGELQQLHDHVLQQYRLLSERQQVRLRQSQVPKKQFSQMIAQRRLHEERNRYLDIIPFDYNRVKLGTLGPNSYDYINASWVEFNYRHQKQEERKKRYIATQGPLPSTCGDFWRMVLEQHVSVIVCLTPDVENGRPKCAPYWPVGNEINTYHMYQQHAHHHSSFSFPAWLRSSGDDGDGDEAEEDVWTIEVKNSQPEQTSRETDSIIRQVEVSCYQHKRSQLRYPHQERHLLAKATVYQLQFLGWADHGVPKRPDHLNALIELANHLQSSTATKSTVGDNDMPPIVVHCSAGCGRTGTFCVVDSAVDWLKQAVSSKEAVVSELDPVAMDPVYYLTDLFRQQRTTMVQTAAQYLFCYHAIWDKLQKIKSAH